MNRSTTLLGLACSLALMAPAAGAQVHVHADGRVHTQALPPATLVAPDARLVPVDAAVAVVPVRSDGWLKGQVTSALARSRLVNASHIDVDVDDGVVTLGGTVASDAQAQQAIAVALATEGVVRVDSRLMVGPVPGASGVVDHDDDDIHIDRPDGWVLAKVKSQLLASDLVGGLDINVDVNEGTVWLKGLVDSAAEAAEAVRLAQSTEGVARVVSELVIR